MVVFQGLVNPFTAFWKHWTATVGQNLTASWRLTYKLRRVVVYGQLNFTTLLRFFFPFLLLSRTCTKSWAVKRQKSRKVLFVDCFPLGLNVTEGSPFLTLCPVFCYFYFHKPIERFTLICLALHTRAPLMALALELINIIWMDSVTWCYVGL